MTWKEDAKKLNSGAKAFVPHNSNLKANAPSWKPGDTPAEKSSGGGGSAWGKKSSDAIRAAPNPNQQQQHNHHRGGNTNNNNNNTNNSNNNWTRGNKHKGGRNNNNNNHRNSNHRNNNNNNNNNHNNNNNNNNDGWQRGKSLPVELFTRNSGKTDAEKAIVRIGAIDLLSLRLSYVAPPLSWGDSETGPPEHCLWNTETRIAEIVAMSKAPRISGDVSHDNTNNKRRNKNKNKDMETAPPLEDCKPLEVNNETRWQAKVFQKDGPSQEEEEKSNETILKKALLILNKLSLTKFDKLSDSFIQSGIGSNEDCLNGAIGLIIQKAHEEHHFAAMYAGLCLKLARTTFDFEQGSTKKGKRFKKMLLEACQKEFESDTETKIAKAVHGITDVEEINYHAAIIKKHYLGHMRFIGELYKGDLISIKIMLYCLAILLEGDVTTEDDKKGDTATTTTEDDNQVNSIDEEKVECFTKLMITIGSSLEQQCEAMKSIGKEDASEKLAQCWSSVEIMAGRKKGKVGKVSNRIKFMLQDLLEMRENGWASRRQEETAKTIAQIHKEVAKEEARTKRSASNNSLNRISSGGSIRRQGSNSNLRNLSRSSSKPSIDADGFVSVPSSAFGRSASMGNFSRRASDGNNNRRNSTNKRPETNRSSSASSRGAFSALNEIPSEIQIPKRRSKKQEKELPALVNEQPTTPEKPKRSYLPAKECKNKAENYIKEFFVNGELEDTVLSFDELIGAGEDGSIERGTNAVEAMVLLVLEMKADEVQKFLTVASKCFEEKKLEAESINNGLQAPLELLNDIVIDAPLASSHLSTIVAEVVKANITTFDFLLDAPDWFKTSGKAAQFGCKVMKKIGGEALESKSNLEVVAKLMTDDDRSTYDSPEALLEAS